MKTTLPVVLGCLAAVFTAAILLGLLIHKVAVRRGAVATGDWPLSGEGVGPAVGFITGSTAFLLGVLMLASLNHYNAAKDIVAQEALAYSAAFDGSEGLAPTDRSKIQRDLVCLIRSVATKSWAAAEHHDLTGSENTHAWRGRALTDANGADPKTRVEETSLATVHSELLNASKAGQQRLLAAEGDLPTPLWILVFVSIFLLTAFLTVLLQTHPVPILAVAVLAAVVTLGTAMITVLTMFAEPFSQGDGVFISPRALNAVMVRLEGTYPRADWGPCETLAEEHQQ